MKKAVILIILSILFIQFQAQEKKQLYLEESLKSISGNHQFSQNSFRLSQRIHQFKVKDSLVTFQLRNKRNNGFLKDRGKIVQFDLKNKKLLWEFVISYVYEHIVNIGDFFYYYTQTRSYQLDPISGKKVRKLATNYIYVDTAKSIGLGYPIKLYPDNSNRLEAVDLTKGEKLWQREVQRSGIWSNVEKVNDSSILILADGLEKINLYNGSGWIISAQSKELNKGIRTVAIIGGFAVAGIFGGIMVDIALPMPSQNIQNRPNNFINEDTIYYASLSNRLIKGDNKGNEIWSADVMESDLQLSELMKHKNKLILTYAGQFFDGKRMVSRKRPKLSVVDANNGKILFDNDLKPRSYYSLEDKYIYKDSLLLVYPSELAYFDLKNNRISHQRKIEGAEFKKVITKKIFVKNDTKFELLNEPNSFYIQNEKNKVYKVNSSLEVTKNYNSPLLFYQYLEYKNTALFVNINSSQSYLADQLGNILLELPPINQAYFKNDKLYYAYKNYFMEVNLSTYLNNN